MWEAGPSEKNSPSSEGRAAPMADCRSEMFGRPRSGLVHCNSRSGRRQCGECRSITVPSHKERHMKSFKQAFSAMAAALLGAGISALAFPPTFPITYQGQLKQAGTPVNGNVNMTFR